MKKKISDHVINSRRSPLAHKYNKVFFITINHSNAGFFAHVTFVLNQLVLCEKRNYLPVVYFGKYSVDGPNPFYDPNYGENIWDYYFEPVAEYTYDDIQAMLKDTNNPLTANKITQMTSEELWRLHEYDPDSIYNYPYGCYRDKYIYDEEWYHEQRKRARFLINKYIKVKSHICDEVESFYGKKLQGHKVLGIHMRGTDKGTAHAASQLMRIIKPKEYFPYIDEYIKKYNSCKIFVATDQHQYVEDMKEKYRERIISFNVIRSESYINPFQKNDENHYRKGREVLIDCLLLSKCNFLLKCTSAVGEYAVYFNPELNCIDLNHIESQLNFFKKAMVTFNRLRGEAFIHGIAHVARRELENAVLKRLYVFLEKVARYVRRISRREL